MHCRGMRAAQLEFGLTARWLSFHHGHTAIVQYTDTIAPVQQVAELACSGFKDILPRVSNYGQSVSNATRNQTIKTVVPRISSQSVVRTRATAACIFDVSFSV